MPAPLGPFCQSCSMPLMHAEDFGTDARGFRINDYCRFCFQDGAFTEAELTMDEMAARLVTMCDKMHMTPDQAAEFARATLPKLGRWRKVASPRVRASAARQHSSTH